MRFRIANNNQARQILNLSSRTDGFVLPFVMFLAGSLILAAAMLASMSGAGIFSAFSQVRSKQAQEAAEAGVDVIINTLNANANRKLLVAAVPLNSWNNSGSLSRLRNPCRSAQSSPSSTALQFGNNRENPIGGDSRHVFILKTVTLRNPGRSATYASSSDANGAGGTNGISSGGYTDNGINLDLQAENPNGGFIEVVVEGRIYDGSGRLQSVARVTREFAVIPKCCDIGFSPPYGSDNRLCTQATIVLGLNGGGLSISGTPAPTLFATTSLLDSTTSSSKPATIPCFSGTSLCGNATNQTSLDGVAVNVIGNAPPTAPAYPACTNCNTGFTINLNSTTDSSGATSSSSAKNSDYLRVNSSGQVEMCNTPNDNNSTNLYEPNLPTTPLASCNSSINSYCVKNGATSDPVFHCRISSLMVLDGTAGSINTGSDPKSNRVQNNTLWIDTTRGSIYLYLNAAWIGSITLSNGIRDGQIQHLSCLDNSGAILSSYASTGVCAQTAKPQDIPRAMILSDTNITFTVGDDGFARDLFFYFPKGTLAVNYPTNYGCYPPTPILRGMMWINNLALTRGTCTSNVNTAMQLAVPPSGPLFSSSNPLSLSKPMVYEWVARSSTFTSLF